MASPLEILAACKIRRPSGPTQEILRKSEAHQMVAQSLGPRCTKPRSLGHKAWVSSAQSWGWVAHKSGSLGSCTWVPCIVLYGLTRD